MELKYLQTLKTILDTGSFVAAARRLNYTQSTVTFQMQQLEQELSVKLFEKIGRRMVLSQAGQELLPYIDAILENVEQLKNHGKTARELQGVLRVAAPESLITYKMQPVLQAFREQAPHVQLTLQAMNCYALRDYVMSDGADLGVQYDVGGFRSGAVLERLSDYEMAMIAAPGMDSAQLDFITPKQRKEICLLTNDREAVYQKRIGEYLRKKDIAMASVMEVGSLEAIKRSVMSGLGVAFLPYCVVEEELRTGQLRRVPTELDRDRISAVILRHKNKWLSPGMALFMQLTKEAM